MNKILIIDDEMQMEQSEYYLTKEPYCCEKAATRKEALSHLKEHSFSLVLIEVAMEQGHGWDLCAEIRKSSDVPIIIVSVCTDKTDIVSGLKLGADDYVTKPVHPEELLARIEALMRRTQPRKEIEINGLCWNEDCFKLTYNHKQIKLTPKEFSLLGHLMRHANQVFSREQIISLLWGYATVTDARTVDSHVQNIRDKVGKSGFPINDHFKTIWGIGYQWIS